MNGDEKNHCGEILVFYSDINFQKLENFQK